MKKIQKLGTITLALLSSQYLLGMLTALFGGDGPDDRTIFSHIFFGLHTLVALVVTSYSAIYYKQIKSSPDKKIIEVAKYANIATIVSFVSGVATVSLHGVFEELASLSMAVTFLVAFAGYLYLQFARLAKDSTSK